MQIDVNTLKAITHARADMRNVKSVVDSFNKYAHLPAIALNAPHRAVQFFAQIGHESGGFRYDEEVWGPTKAQERYDTRTDLGNTAAQDGDGKKYLGRTGIMITGKSNYRQFRDWLKTIGLNPPDFVTYPDRVNEDPWEGLAPIWYWTTRRLNQYADNNDIEIITRRINGGLNGYNDRIANYVTLALSVLGYVDVRAFQTAAQKRGLLPPDTADVKQVDGVAGPKTRAAMHTMLVEKGNFKSATAPSPVVVTNTKTVEVDVPVPVAAEGSSNTLLQRIAGFVGVGSPLAAMFSGFNQTGVLILIGLGIAATIILLWHGELIAARTKAVIASFDK